MKCFTALTVLMGFFSIAFAQFPLGANRDSITRYFEANIPYSSFQQFDTKKGNQALCYTKTGVLGDYTFYFDGRGVCTSYTETYDQRQLEAIIGRMDIKFCRVSAREWSDENNSFRVILEALPAKGANFVSITYKLIAQSPVSNAGSLAVN